jgi:hypothetical protein
MGRRKIRILDPDPVFKKIAREQGRTEVTRHAAGEMSTPKAGDASLEIMIGDHGTSIRSPAAYGEKSHLSIPARDRGGIESRHRASALPNFPE